MSAQRNATAAAAVAIAPAYLTPTASSVISRLCRTENYHFRGPVAVEAGRSAGARPATETAEILIEMLRGYIGTAAELILAKSRG